MGSIGYTEANRALFLLKGEQLCLNEEKTRRKGNPHSAYAKTLEELREKELDVFRDVLNAIGFVIHLRLDAVRRMLAPNLFNRSSGMQTYAELCRVILRGSR